MIFSFFIITWTITIILPINVFFVLWFLFLINNPATDYFKQINIKYSYNIEKVKIISEKYVQVFYEIIFLKEKINRCLKIFFLASLLTFFKFILSFFFIENDLSSFQLNLHKASSILEILSFCTFLWGCFIMSLFNIKGFCYWKSFNNSGKKNINIFYCCLFFLFLEYYSIIGSILFLIFNFIQLNNKK